MSQLFDKIKVGSTKRSTFDLSHNQITTSDFGYLIPICYRDMVPNDDFVVQPSVMCRLSPLAVPCYGRMYARIHHFFVPYRILFPHWDAFITQDRNNNHIPPYFTASVLNQALRADPQFSSETTTYHRGTFGRLMANLGLNPSLFVNDEFALSGQRFSAFPFLAYYRIWMDYFADTNIYDHPALVAAFNDAIKDGGSLIGSATDFLKTRNVCYKKDYFTTAKINPQDGDPSIVGVDIASPSLNPALSLPSSSANLQITPSGNIRTSSSSVTDTSSKIGQFTIEALRASDAAQRYKERNNFVGTKIINRILAHFGIAPTPERLDMAEFIDGGNFPFEIRDVTSHNSIADIDDNYSTYGLGMQAGKGVATYQGLKAHYHAKEHGIFMSVMSILPDTSYYQGVSRMWQKGVTGDALDFFHPEFENLGYQEVLNKEVYVSQNHTDYSSYDADGIFGYVPRYSEYKFHNDILAGDFVNKYGTSGGSTGNIGAYMDTWHLFRKLVYNDVNPLALNENFVECDNHNTNYDRIFQITDNEFDHFYFSIFCDVKATRPMDGFTAPSLENNNSGDGNTINLPYGGTRL